MATSGSLPDVRSHQSGPGGLPDFLIIGAAKAGTTSLYNYLGQHPDIYVPPAKEPNYFLFAGADPHFSGPGDASHIMRLSVKDLPSYRGLFSGRTTERVAGEASHWYLYSPDAPGRIQELIPDVKLIAILRHPVACAYSTHRFMCLEGREKVLDFDQALVLEPERIASGWAWGRYLDRGYYFRQLSRYYERFDRANIRVYLYEDLVHTPQALLRDLFRFLGVYEDFEPNVSRRYNPSGRPRWPFVSRIYRAVRHVYRVAAGPSWVPKVLRNRLRTLYHRQLVQEPLDKSRCLQLVDRFRDDVLSLEKLIGRDLRPWLDCREAPLVFRD